MLSFISAFLLNPNVSGPARAQVQGLFAPVAYPAHWIGSKLHAHFFPIVPRDSASPDHPRAAADLVIENTSLRISVANLEAQLEKIEAQQNERAKVGAVQKFCTPFAVIGADSSNGESLMLGGTTFGGLREGLPVLYAGGIAGRILRAGAGGAQVLLVTDPRFRVVVNFARPIREADGSMSFPRLQTQPLLLSGAGRDSMHVQMTQKDVTDIQLRENDWAVLADREWPNVLTGYRIGYVDQIKPSKEPGFVDIFLLTDQSLTKLDEVQVMNR